MPLPILKGSEGGGNDRHKPTTTLKAGGCRSGVVFSASIHRIHPCADAKLDRRRSAKNSGKLRLRLEILSRKFVGTYDYVAGDFMWTGIDYLGEAFWPMKSSPSGVIDTCGFKKDGAYFYQSQWTNKPALHIFPHWNWKGKEGQFVPVTCYTNCETVELFLNGKSIGVKGYAFPRMGMEDKWANYPARARVLRTTADLHLSWDVPYEPGTLKAVGSKDGKTIATVEISTTGEPAAIDLSADRSAISADRRDVAHFTVKIVDEKDRVVPLADNEVTLDVEGEGRLIGVDSGDPMSHEDYTSNRRKAFHGLCLAILQSSGKPGSIRVTASAPSLKSRTMTINSSAPEA